MTQSSCVVQITDIERTRVIKRIVRNTPEECKALECEASILRKLNHPCIYKLYEYRSWQDENSKHTCEIEVEGFAGSLEDEIRKRRQGFDEREVECMLWDIASALAYAQDKNVTHRDVKPSNILVSPGRRFTLADFGEGKFVNPDSDGIHTVRGTPFFCSPEMKKNMGSGEKYAGYEPFISDVYSLGVSALNMLRPGLENGPFSPSHFQEVLSQQLLSPHLRGLLERMFEQDPRKRGDCKSICALLRQEFRSHYEVDRKTRELSTELRTCEHPQADSPSLVRVRNSLIELMNLPVDIAAWLLPTEQCIVCKEVFQINDSDAWRSAQQEPNIVTTNLCSQRCYLTAAKRGQMTSNCLSCGVNLQGKFSYFLHCRVHICCRACKDGIKGKFFGKWRICPDCEFLKVTKRPFRMELVSISFEGFEEFQFVCDENALPTANPKNLFPSDLHPAVKSPHCHRCETPIHCYQHWFLIICGDQPNYLCSYRCLQALFPDSQTKSVRCPKCTAEIRNSQAAVLQEGGVISSWPAPLNSHCRICMLRPSVKTLPCAHSYCAVCLYNIDRRTKHRNFYCLLCGLRQSQDELREGVALVLGLLWAVRQLLDLGLFLYRRNQSLERYKYGWAVVTGATDGIGKATCAELLRQGFKVGLVSRTQSKLESVRAEFIRQFPNAQIEIVRADFSASLKDPSDFYTNLSKSLEAFGDISVLVNNVGIMHWKPLEQTSFQEIEEMVAVNILPQTYLARIVMPGMSERYRRVGRESLIINLSSSASALPLPSLSVYGATKAYNNYLSQTMSVEAPRGVTVVSVLPGMVATNMPKINNIPLQPGTVLPEAFARQMLQNIGQGWTSGHATHMVLSWITRVLLDNPLGYLIVKKAANDIAKTAAKKR